MGGMPPQMGGMPGMMWDP